jgi:hypothetical protein
MEIDGNGFRAKMPENEYLESHLIKMWIHIFNQNSSNQYQVVNSLLLPFF